MISLSKSNSSFSRKNSVASLGNFFSIISLWYVLGQFFRCCIIDNLRYIPLIIFYHSRKYTALGTSSILLLRAAVITYRD